MFKDIKGFENYQVNEYGDILSKGRIITDTVGHVYARPEIILKPYLTKKGYLQVSLMQDKKRSVKYVHRLVAEAFIENNDPTKTVVNHKDGNKQNCYYENLEWTTYSDNNQHAYDNNLKGRGSKFYNAKLTEEDVREIKLKGKGSLTYQKIGDMYGVSGATIRDILVGKTWKHVK